jgi:hypothetical protein
MSAVPLWKVIVGPVPTNWNRTLAGPVFFEPEARQDRGARHPPSRDGRPIDKKVQCFAGHPADGYCHLEAGDSRGG